jgi:hypothetical protein
MAAMGLLYPSLADSTRVQFYQLALEAFKALKAIKHPFSLGDIRCPRVSNIIAAKFP